MLLQIISQLILEIIKYYEVLTDFFHSQYSFYNLIEL